MWIKTLVLIFIGFAAGGIVSTGIFTVFIAVGLIPRFADKTDSGGYILLYENMIILGTLIGSIISVFYDLIMDTGFSLPGLPGFLIVTIYGLMTGIYVGCLALAIAEIADAIPIMAHRLSLKRGIGFVVLGIAVGKFLGSIFYYTQYFFTTGQ